jgi:hypothetical protein
MKTNEPRVGDNSLDRVIDDVARRMTAIEPPADLRARIMIRIDARPERAPRWWTRRLVPIAVGAAAVAMIGVALRLPHRATAPAAPAVSAPVPAPIESGAVADATDNRDTSLDQPRARVTATKVASAAQPSDEELAWLERAVPALAQLEALAVASIQPETLTIAHIEVKPLVTGPVNPAPVNSGGLR